MMAIFQKFLVCCLFLLLINQCPHTSSATIQTCSTYTASAVAQYQTIYAKTYYACGYMGWSSCSEVTSYTAMYTIYVAVQDCCKGYAGANCTAYCSFDCLYNSECSSPETCTCIDGWEGEDCLTDIDECGIDTDLCEFHDTCVNGEGSYSCSCPHVNQVLANDGHRCLEGVSSLDLKPGKRTVKFEVDVPSSFNDDGEFEGFSAGCTSGNDYQSGTFYGNDSSIDLTGLQPFTSYNCCIQPRWTYNGLGPKACEFVTTLQDAPEDPPRNVTVETISERSVLVKWSPPEDINGILESYNLFFNYTNHTPIHQITVLPVYTFFLHEYLKPHQTVSVSMSARTIGGEGPMAAYESTTTYQDEPGAVDDLQVTILAPYAANVSWYPPEQLNGIILQYYINITKETPTDLKEVFFSDELEPMEAFYIVLNNLESYIPYTVSIAAETKIGLGEIYPVTFFTSQNIPSASPIIMDVHLRAPFTVSVSWEPLMLWQLRGYLLHYQLILSESNNEYCNNTLNHVTINSTMTTVSLSISPFKSYCISVSASTSVGQGESSKWLYLQEQATSALEVHMIGVKDCFEWTPTNHDIKLNTTLTEFANAINLYCDCNVDVSYFTKARFLCTELDTNRVIMQALVVGLATANSDTMIEYLQRWTNTRPEIIILGTTLLVDDNCPVAVVSDTVVTNTSCIIPSNEPATPARVEESQTTLDTAEITSIVLGIGMVFCLGIIVILITVICYNKGKSRKNDKIDTVLFNDENDDGDDGDNDKHMLLELGQHHSNDDGGTINKVVEEVEPLTGVMFTVKDNDDDTLY